LASVYRSDDDLDKPLMNAFESGWKHAKNVIESEDESHSKNQSSLIRFAFSAINANNPGALFFLNFGQVPFWNHHITRISKKLYPAILLTDTGEYNPNLSTLNTNYPLKV